MSNELLAAKIVVLEEAPRIPAIAAQPTAVTGVVGVTERGPIGVATLVTSWEEYVNIFGGYTADSDVAIAANGFFYNGGSFLWVVRTCHYTNPDLATSFTATKGSQMLQNAGSAASPAEVIGSIAGPWNLDDKDDFNITTNLGGPNNAAIAATRGTHTGGGVFPIAPLAGGENMTIDTGDGNGPQTITAAGGETTALDLANLLNSQMSGGYAIAAGAALVVETDGMGSGFALVIAAGAPDLAALIGLTPASYAGTGNVANVNNATPTELKAIIEAADPNVTVTITGTNTLTVATVGLGVANTLQITVGSPDLSAKLGLDNLLHTGADATPENTLLCQGKTEGAYANDITIRTLLASSGDVNEFNLQVIRSGVVEETFPNLTMDDTATNYVETVVNHVTLGSNLITVTDQGLAYNPDVAKPDVNAATTGYKDWGPMTGGDDGLTLLDDNDFIGSSAGETGTYALDRVQQLRILILPGKTGSAIANHMLDYCETWRSGSCFAILDPPPLASVPTAAAMVTYVETTTAILEKSEFGTIYWPRIEVNNPLKSLFGDDDTIYAYPSGYIAGVFARNDSRLGGVYESPAGVEQNAGVILGCMGFESEEVLDERKRDLIYPKRINPITQFPGTARHIDGSRTLKSTSNFPFIGERRGVIFIEQSLKQGLLWVKHRPNNRTLRQRVRRTVVAFLTRQMNVGAFRSTIPSEAFRVDVSDALNPPAVEFAGELWIRVGLATNKPAEFIILLVSQDTRAFEESLAA